MKLPPRAIEGFLRKPDPKVRAVLVYGPDAGLVRERADLLGRGVLEDLSDPFRVADLPGDRLAGDPARLHDEAASLSLIGGRRLIRIRDAGDALGGLFERFFKGLPGGDSLIVVEAGDLSARSSLRLAFEHAEAGAAVPCYTEDEGALVRVVAEIASGCGIQLDGDAQAYLAANLVGDRQLARREIEKLALYVGAGRRASLEDAEACVGDSAALALDDPAWAVANGDPAALDRALGRLYGEGMSPVAILRTAQRHFQRLHLAAAAIAKGQSADAVVASLKPPVFFKLRDAFTAQLRTWSVPDLSHAMKRLTEAEAQCKRTHMPDQTLCNRTLLQLAAHARAQKRRGRK